MNAINDELIIEPGRSFRHYWHDLWRYRELFYILAWRDVAVRYKQTVAGAAWAVVQPLMSMVHLTRDQMSDVRKSRHRKSDVRSQRLRISEMKNRETTRLNSATWTFTV
jgi:hypothetical protein